MKSNTSRLTLDIPTKDHRELKVLASAYGVTMKDLFVKAIPYIKQTLIEEQNACKSSSHIPNEETLESIRNIESGKNLKTYKSVEELFKKLGI